MEISQWKNIKIVCLVINFRSHCQYLGVDQCIQRSADLYVSVVPSISNSMGYLRSTREIKPKIEMQKNHPIIIT